MKTILLAVTYLVGIGELILAGYFWKTRSGNEIRKVMSALALFTGLWVLASVFIAYKTPAQQIIIIDRLIYVFGIFLVTTLLHLTLIYPYPIRILDRLHLLLLYIPTIIFSVITLTTNTIVIGTFGSPTIAGQVLGGPIINHYNTYVLILYTLSIVAMTQQVRRLDGVQLQNARLLLLGIIIGGLPAVLIDLVIPTVMPWIIPNYLYGNLFTSVWLGTVLYILFRRE